MLNMQGSATNRTLCVQEYEAAKYITDRNVSGENAVDVMDDDVMDAIYEMIGLQDGAASEEEVRTENATTTSNARETENEGVSYLSK